MVTCGRGHGRKERLWDLGRRVVQQLWSLDGAAFLEVTSAQNISPATLDVRLNTYKHIANRSSEQKKKKKAIGIGIYLRNYNDTYYTFFFQIYYFILF